MSSYNRYHNITYKPKEWEDVNCPICNSNERKVYELYGDQFQYTHNICKKCRLVYSSPRPKYDEDFIYLAYSHYSPDEKVVYPEVNHEEIAAIHYRGIEKEIQHITSLCGDTESYLDIGCGIGTTAYYAKRHFQDVSASEAAKESAENLEKTLGIKVFTLPFEDMQENKKFSCIHMSHVIEHIPDPNLWLQKARKLLKPDGILVIKVPHIFSFDRKFKVFLKNIKLRKGKWEHWRTPDHLFEPSIPAMRFLFDQNDFEILSEYTYSRKNLMSDTFMQKFLYRKLLNGNNLHYIVRKSG